MRINKRKRKKAIKKFTSKSKVKISSREIVYLRTLIK